jgi:iron complex transport system ATP-binding protein
LSFAVHSGECWALLGPNGAGKTTLLSALAGLRKTQSGRILVRNESLDGRPSRELARYRAFLPQHTYDEFGGTVLETALTGRHPHLGRWHWESEEDERIACAALDAMGLTPEVAPSRDVTTLSGGERQRLALAAMLAQAPQLMLLDEPLAHLDVRHQMRVLDVLRRMVRDENKTVVVVLHEVNLAVRLCDHALLMRDGEVRCGPRDTMLTAANQEWLYQQPMLEARVPGDPLAYFTPR